MPRRSKDTSAREAMLDKLMGSTRRYMFNYVVNKHDNSDMNIIELQVFNSDGSVDATMLAPTREQALDLAILHYQGCCLIVASKGG